MQISIYLPLRLVSEANSRDHWAKKARRAKTARGDTRAALIPLLAARDTPDRYRCTITRIGKRRLDTDNLARAAKAVRDGVADAVGIDDGDDRITWVYGQEIGKTYGVRVEIECE